MKLTAKLNTGWDDKQPEPGAWELNIKNVKKDDYIKYIETFTDKIIKSREKSIVVYPLDKLFRKSTEGLQPIKKFVGALAENPDTKKEVTCYIDVFAYSFLKRAKNFDLLLQLHQEQNEDFKNKYKEWSDDIKKLEKFERFGKTKFFCKQHIFDDQKDIYLHLRKIVSRPSTRDEIRTLATLLVSGPSTLKEISDDLGLHYTLGQRTVGVFSDFSIKKHSPSIGFIKGLQYILDALISCKSLKDQDILDKKDIKILESREKEDEKEDDDEKEKEKEYKISSEALPVVIFCLRETIGLDLLSNLNIEEK